MTVEQLLILSFLNTLWPCNLEGSETNGFPQRERL